MGSRFAKVSSLLTAYIGEILESNVARGYSMCVGEKRKLVIPPNLGKFSLLATQRLELFVVIPLSSLWRPRCPRSYSPWCHSGVRG